MDRVRPVSDVDYPESDGQPMAETPWHLDWTIRLLDQFRQRYKTQPQVYVASNLMVYYTEGVPRDCFSPDLIVLLDSDRRERSVLKLWEERRSPSFILEVTSKSTRRKDQRWKMNLYARLGISEFFLFDPTSDYLSPALQGFRLQSDESYQPIPRNDQGQLISEQTGIAFSLDDDGRLCLHDRVTEELLLTEAESEREAKKAERELTESERRAKERVQKERQEEYAKRVLAEEQARAAELRIGELEAELQRLRG